MRWTVAMTVGVLMALALPGRAGAVPVVVVSTAASAPQTLAVIDSATPDTFTHGPATVTGLSTTERVVGIDYRPATQTLYAVARDVGDGDEQRVAQRARQLRQGAVRAVPRAEESGSDDEEVEGLDGKDGQQGPYGSE